MNNANSFCARVSPFFLFVLRVVVAVLFMQHGGQKLFNYPPGGHGTVPLYSLMGLAGVLELAGGALILLGFLTRPAAFILSGEMAVAYFKVHATNGGGFWPVQNHGELAVIYCFVFLYLAAAGAGAWSVDGCRKKT
jgi:putative oxidoreductase